MYDFPHGALSFVSLLLFFICAPLGALLCLCGGAYLLMLHCFKKLVALYGSFGVDLNHQLPDELTTYQVYADSSIRSQSNVPLLMPSPTLVDEDALVPEHMRLTYPIVEEPE